MDRHLARYVHSAKPWQLTKLVEEAIATFMPEVAAERRRKAMDGRHVWIDTNQVSFDGTCYLTGELDLVDAQDLDAALQAGAETLKQCGSQESLDARRSITLGDLARGHHPLDLRSEDGGNDPVETQRRKRKSTVTLHLHLSEAALTDSSITGSVEEGRIAVTADTIRDWCGAANVIVKPVIDLNDDLTTDAYAIPDRIRDQVTLRNPTCVFPYCTRPSRNLDLDHIDRYDPAGPPGQTASPNLAPLCRQHHRAKTHDHRGSAHHRGWAYTQLEPGTFLWRSPLGLVFLRNADGTTDLTPDTWPHRPDRLPPPERD